LFIFKGGEDKSFLLICEVFVYRGLHWKWILLVPVYIVLGAQEIIHKQGGEHSFNV
jgi:hypothetical protein